MSGLRLLAASAAAVAVLGTSCFPGSSPDCAIPTLKEKGADGGPDPCHCDPPPSLNMQACPCDQSDIDVFNACLVTYWAEIDAGLE
jgi:hypothetical protein